MYAYNVADCYWQGAALLGCGNTLHTAFPENVEDEYILQGIKSQYAALIGLLLFEVYTQ